MAEHGLVGVLSPEPGRGGEQGREGAEERGDDDEREKELHHGRADIDHGHDPALTLAKTTAAIARTREPASRALT
ncbi:hypothetical protein SGLAM104S_08169 [Streptomyces glaucescens]